MSILRDVANMRAQGAQEFRTFSGADHSAASGSAARSWVGRKLLVHSMFRDNSWLIPSSGTRVGATVRGHAPRRPDEPVGLRCHHAAMPCDREHEHPCRGDSATNRVSARAESSSALRTTRPAAAATMESVAPRTGYPEHSRSAVRLPRFGEVTGKPDKSDENVGERDNTAHYRPVAEAFRSVARYRHRRSTTRPRQSLEPGESCPTQ